MATIEQLEKQRQDLVTSYTQILKDTSIPSSDKAQIIKDLSRAIAVKDQQQQQQQRKEEIKQIMKEKKELQPKTIPISAEQGEWDIKEVVRFVKIDFTHLPEVTHEEDGSIQWDKFADVVIPKLMEQIREKMVYYNSQFPIALQTTMKAVCNRLDSNENVFYKNYRTNSISNIKHIANNFEQVEKILREHLSEIIEETQGAPDGDSLIGIVDVKDYYVRFWEYRPSVVRKVNKVYAKDNGYIETNGSRIERPSLISRIPIINALSKAYIEHSTMIRRIETTIETLHQKN
jgi:predicted transcriptional regulator